MADSAVVITAGSGTSIDTRTETTNSQHRQVVVVGGPSVNDAIAEVVSVPPSTSDTSYGQVVRIAGSIQIGGYSGSAFLTGVYNSIAIFFDRANPSVSIGGASASIGIFFDRGNPAVNPSVAYDSGVTGATTQRVVHVTDIGASVKLMPNSGVDVGDVDVTSVTPGTTGTQLGKAEDAAHTSTDVGVFALAVRNDTRASRTSADNDYSPVSVDTAGAMMLADPFGTAAVTYATASSTASTAGNNTVVSPEASRNIKVYAYQLTTTAQVGHAALFTTGASAGATELWRTALQAPSQGIAGANLSVRPPAYLFATGAGNTLALYLSSGSLVHYSVAYFKESA